MVRIAVSGKGGVGKTTLAAILAHLFAKEGYRVTAIDCDSSINLPTALGVKDEVKPLAELKDVVKERVIMRNGVFRYNPKVDDIFEEYSKMNEDGVRVVVLGTIEKGGEGCFCPENAFLRAILRHAIFKGDEVLILDMEAGIEHLGRATAKGVDLLIAVVEPGMRSIETLKRIRKLAGDIGIGRIAVVINKFVDTKESKALLKKIELPVIGVISYSQCFVEADLKNIPPYKACKLDAFVEVKNKLMEILKQK